MKLLLSLVKLLVLAAVLVGVWIGYGIVDTQRQWIDRQNETVALMNEDDCKKALPLLRSLADDMRERQLYGLEKEHLKRVEKMIAQCLVAIADTDYAAPLKENLARYREAYALDPDSIDDPVILRALDVELGD